MIVQDSRFYIGCDGPEVRLITCQGCENQDQQLYLCVTPYGLVAVCEGCYDYIEYLNDLHNPAVHELRSIWN